jgi:hypothetical protein
MEDNIIYSNILAKPLLSCFCCSESRGGIAAYGPPPAGYDCNSAPAATMDTQGEECDAEGGTLFSVEDFNLPPMCQ